MAQALRELDPTVELLFVGSSHGPEGDLVAKAGIPFRAVPSSPLTKAISARNAVSFGRLIAGVFRAQRILKVFGAEVAVGTGGYTTAAVLIAQRSLGGRIVIHEQNAVPGRTNRWLSRIADRVCVTFEGSETLFPREKVLVTGLPVREEFRALPDKQKARLDLGLNGEAFTILAVGGSQGAKRLNELLIAAWPLIDDGRTQVLHQVGERNLEEARRLLGDRERYRIEAYVDMPVAMAAADLLIGRSGASTVAEITLAGLPSILVPYPYAIANEQKANAAYLVERGAAILCQESSLTPETLAETVTGLRSDSEKLSAMASASASLAKPDAARRVAEVAISLNS